MSGSRAGPGPRCAKGAATLRLAERASATHSAGVRLLGLVLADDPHEALEIDHVAGIERRYLVGGVLEEVEQGFVHCGV